MTEWTLAPQAEEDLLDLYLYGVETFGLEDSNAYVDSLTDCFELLAAQPGMGRSVDAMHRGARRFEHRRHVIYYEKRGPAILILAIVHERSIRGVDG